jgi:hypothetical protein
MLICSERIVLLAGCWFVVREKYCWLVADKPSEQGVLMQTIPSEYKDQQSRKNSTSIVHLTCVSSSFIVKKHLSVVAVDTKRDDNDLFY